jgi:hypothetical protein
VPPHARRPGGLARYVVWFVIDLASRRVHIAGLVRQPHEAWIHGLTATHKDQLHRDLLAFLRS